MKSALLAAALALCAGNISAQAIHVAVSSDDHKSASVNALEAERRLAQAKRARRQGLTPLPGESVPIPGGIAVNKRYWNRQEKLRLEVEQAQRRSNETHHLELAQR